MIMSFEQRKIKFAPRTNLHHNIYKKYIKLELTGSDNISVGQYQTFIRFIHVYRFMKVGIDQPKHWLNRSVSIIYIYNMV